MEAPNGNPSKQCVSGRAVGPSASAVGGGAGGALQGEESSFNSILQVLGRVVNGRSLSKIARKAPACI